MEDIEILMFQALIDILLCPKNGEFVFNDELIWLRASDIGTRHKRRGRPEEIVQLQMLFF